MCSRWKLTCRPEVIVELDLVLDDLSAAPVDQFDEFRRQRGCKSGSFSASVGRSDKALPGQRRRTPVSCSEQDSPVLF